MNRVKIVVAAAVVVFFCLPSLAFAQDGFFADWFDRVGKAESEQPHWASPLATTTPRLTERVRYDQLWQTNS
jgi:hypothetical protein